MQNINSTIDIDFTFANLYGINAQDESALIHSMWPGDGDGDGQVIYQGSGSDILSITSIVFSDPLNTTFQQTFPSVGYQRADFNMDGETIYQGAGSDILGITGTVFGSPQNSTFQQTFPVVEQLP